MNLIIRIFSYFKKKEEEERKSISYFNDKKISLKNLFKNNEELYFNDLQKTTGWSEYDLTSVLKNLVDVEFIDELINNESGKIYYKMSQNDDNDYLTIEQRLEKFKSNS